jgi:hypothetical protein
VNEPKVVEIIVGARRAVVPSVISEVVELPR